MRPSVDLRGWRGGKPLFVRLADGRPVELTSTPCHFGGERWWLVCPECQRRCQVLYGVCCRLCRGAVHRTTILSPQERLLEKALRMRSRLGQTGGGLLLPFPPRPKHMRQATYWKLRLTCRAIEQALLQGIAREFGITLPSREPKA